MCGDPLLLLRHTECDEQEVRLRSLDLLDDRRIVLRLEVAIAHANNLNARIQLLCLCLCLLRNAGRRAEEVNAPPLRWRCTQQFLREIIARHTLWHPVPEVTCRPDRSCPVCHDECRRIEDAAQFGVVCRTHNHLCVRRCDHHTRRLIHIGAHGGNCLRHCNRIDMHAQYIDTLAQGHFPPNCTSRKESARPQTPSLFSTVTARHCPPFSSAQPCGYRVHAAASHRPATEPHT